MRALRCTPAHLLENDAIAENGNLPVAKLLILRLLLSAGHLKYQLKQAVRGLLKAGSV